MVVNVLSFVAIIMVAYVLGKLVSKVKMPQILGWLIAGMIFGPHLVGIVDQNIINQEWYKITIKLFETFAGVMIGSEIVFKRLKAYGKQLTVITLFESVGTFVIVSLIFGIVFMITGAPLYLALIFGGIALATAPAPALSIINEFKTEGPVTDTLIPVAAIDDVVAIVVFFTIITVISSVLGTSSSGAGITVLMTLLPFVIGIVTGLAASFIINKVKDKKANLGIMILFLVISLVIGLLLDKLIGADIGINYLLVGMSFSATLANLIKEEMLDDILKLYNPILTLSFLIVIVNLGMPLDYTLIAGAGLFTFVYIISRAIGKIGGSYLGGKVSNADSNVTKYLGFTLLPHSGVSLVFAGIAATTLISVGNVSETIIATITAAAIINEIIAVILAKQGFKWANEIQISPQSHNE